MKSYQLSLPQNSMDGLNQIDFQPQLILIFGGKTLLQQSDWVQEIRRKFPQAIMAGCSTAGEISGTTVHDESLSVNLLAFERSEVRYQEYDIQDSKESFEAGKTLAQAFEAKNLKHLFVLSDGLNVNGSQLVDGLREGIGGDNLKAALVPIGFAEGRRLLVLLGAEQETSLGPAGLGDLYVTSTSPRSRNRTLGEKLGQGKSLEEGLAEMHMVAEGVRAARMFRKRATQVGCNAPFTESLNKLLDGEISAEECVREMVEQSL